ncbi:2-oxoisovalerate dehydrogenase E2 component (dihydrolipoyl transacylase) [Paenibacillus turicensis]|uniref:Dihydrolipoamide acetyltransferase component of pyruvate dehydrogenase complex n=1 Tax=Paenibacillus turicensis TaxID=160487 RepID=A0ABS4FVP5_9BACL|nr:dihydrolipoamide acetyltransferase family protein [Paenibacillus turicensis]MBP1906650.1 2-oxoisovalerate dehydrogenase E2 component (dihydrolipoyl transacylase) [Paenibacillus turicensis]
MLKSKNLVDVVMPQLAESLVSATIAKWLKKPGDNVEEYEPICEVITDKVNAEIPSTMDGVMGEILADEGQEVAVGHLICRIEVASEEQGHSQANVNNQANASNQANMNNQVNIGNQLNVNANGGGSDNSALRGRYSPAVLTLAAEHGIALEQLQGSGLGGRITRKDVLNYIQSGASTSSQGATSSTGATLSTAAAASISSVPTAPANPTPIAVEQPKAVPVRNSGLHLSETPAIPKIEVEAGNRSEYLIDVTPIRSAIARNMRQSVSEIPHGWMMIEVDVTNMVQLRNKLKDDFKKKEGINLTYLAFMMKAVVSAIKDYPIMNSVWAVDKIIVKRDINISLAVGTEDSVLTPVIQKADQKNIAGLAKEIDDLASKVRAGKLKLDDMQNGTFTVNNTGSFGSILSQPIINYPQAAILTFESIVKKPVVINDMLAIRSMANLCLSLDHRILDGVICGRFMQRVKDNIEGYTLDTQVY